jgi:hypothetical protein
LRTELILARAATSVLISRRLGIDTIFGFAIQDHPYQREVKERAHLPNDLLVDEA